MSRWAATDSEARYRQASWRELAADPELLTRRGDPAHFTASALPVTPDGTSVCLVLHPLLGRWVQPGGHFEATDRSVMGAAAREMAEETGLVGRLDPIPLLLSRHAARCRPAVWHLDLQMLAVTTRAALGSEESPEVAWFDADDLPSPVAPGVAELVAAARSRISRNGSPAQLAPEG